MGVCDLASYVAYSLQQQRRAGFGGPGRLVTA
jgi:hypothetical protein